MNEIELSPISANEDGWTDWQFPTSVYRMQCCNCGLVHRVQFSVDRIIERRSDGSFIAEAVSDPALRVSFRMARESEDDQPLPDMREHVEDFAKKSGWDKESGEGAFEYAQRISYELGLEEARTPGIWQSRMALLLKDPAAVHHNMLVGKIAKIDMMTCAHTHGEDMVRRWRAFEDFENYGRGQAQQDAKKAKGDIVGWLRRRSAPDGACTIPGKLAGEIADHIEGLAMDAARYRWLRDGAHLWERLQGIKLIDRLMDYPPEGLDASIDEAMKQDKDRT